MKEKVILKSEYKDLVRAGDLEKAQVVIEKIWSLCGIVKTEKASEPVSSGYSKEYLESLSFKKLKKIGLEFGTTDRSKTNLIKEILNLQ